MKLGEIRYRADSGIEVDLTLSTAETLGNVLTDMDLAVLTAKLRIISARVDRAAEADGVTLRHAWTTPEAAAIESRATSADYSRAVEVMREVDGDPFR